MQLYHFMRQTFLFMILTMYSINVLATSNKDTVYNNFDSDLYDRVKSCISIQCESVHLFNFKNPNNYENSFASIYDDYIYLFHSLQLERREFCNSNINQFDKIEIVKSIILNKENYSESYSIGNIVYVSGDMALAPAYEFGILLFNKYNSFTFLIFSPNNMQFTIISTNTNYSIRIKGITLSQKDLDTLIDIFS